MSEIMRHNINVSRFAEDLYDFDYFFEKDTFSAGVDFDQYFLIKKSKKYSYSLGHLFFFLLCIVLTISKDIMKKYFSLLALLLLTTLSCFTFIASGGDDEDNNNNFNYPLVNIYGTWEAQEVCVEGKWYDVTVYPYTVLAGTITFYEDSRFYGTAYFGQGNIGTYKAVGNKIITYIDGKEYITYTIDNLSGNTLEVTRGVSSMKIKLKKN